MSLQRLAYVDDDADICEIVRFALSDVGGLDVRCWRDGATFLREAGGDWTPQLVLLDVNMPGMSGWDVVAGMRAKAVSADWPVVVLSGCRDAASAGARADVLGCVTKPFDPLQLAKVLEAMWSRHLEAGEQA